MILRILTFACLFALCMKAHVLHYDVKKGAIYSEVFFGGGAVASYAPYEVYAPDSSLPFVKGSTDARGILAFLPDRDGVWHVVVHAGSDHGEHRVEFDINISGDSVKLDGTPLYNRYYAIITGVCAIFGIFSFLYALSLRRRLARK